MLLGRMGQSLGGTQDSSPMALCAHPPFVQQRGLEGTPLGGVRWRGRRLVGVWGAREGPSGACLH